MFTVGTPMRESRSTQIVGLFGYFDPKVPIKGPSFHGIVTHEERGKYQHIEVKPLWADPSNHCGLILSTRVADVLLKSMELDQELRAFCCYIIAPYEPCDPTWTPLNGGAAWVIDFEHKVRYHNQIRDVLREYLLENPKDPVRVWDFQRSAILVEDDALVLATLSLQGEDISELADSLLADIEPSQRGVEIDTALKELTNVRKAR